MTKVLECCSFMVGKYYPHRYVVHLSWPKLLAPRGWSIMIQHTPAHIPFPPWDCELTSQTLKSFTSFTLALHLNKWDKPNIGNTFKNMAISPSGAKLRTVPQKTGVSCLSFLDFLQILPGSGFWFWISLPWSEKVAILWDFPWWITIYFVRFKSEIY